MNSYIEETHTYLINGEEVASVTEICNPITFDKYNILPQHLLKYVADRGSRIHDYLEEYCLTGVLDYEEVDSDCLPYIYAFEEWYRTYRPKVLYTELMMFHKDKKYAGRTDLICIIDNKVINIDFKSTATINNKALSVQMYGYKELAKEGVNEYDNPIDLHIEESWVLQLKKDQTYVFKKVETDQEWFELLLKHTKKMKGTNKNGK